MLNIAEKILEGTRVPGHSFEMKRKYIIFIWPNSMLKDQLLTAT